MYIRNLIASSVFNLARPINNSRRLSQLARQFLPYALFKRSDSRFIVLNRQYKPIGFPTQHDHFFDYNSNEFLLLTLPNEQVSATPSDSGMVMLYTTPPWFDANAANEYRRTMSSVLGFTVFSEAGE